MQKTNNTTKLHREKNCLWKWYFSSSDWSMVVYKLFTYRLIFCNLSIRICVSSIFCLALWVVLIQGFLFFALMMLININKTLVHWNCYLYFVVDTTVNNWSLCVCFLTKKLMFCSLLAYYSVDHMCNTFLEFEYRTQDLGVSSTFNL